MVLSATLEILTGARDEDSFAGLDRALAALPQAPVTTAVCAAGTRRVARSARQPSAARGRRPDRGGRSGAASACCISTPTTTRSRLSLGFASVRLDRD